MKINEYTIESDKINKDLNLAILSDIHIDNKTSKKKLDKILDNIDSIKPTHIIIPGDLYNIEPYSYYDNRRNTTYDKTAYLIHALSDITKTYYIKGNTDTNIAWPIYDYHPNIFPIITYKTPNEIKRIYNYKIAPNIFITGYAFNKDFYMLNEKQKIKKILEEYKIILESISSKTHKENYNIFVCHDPIIIKALQENKELVNNYNFDLTITAHSHGGLLPIWLKPIVKHMNIDIELAYPNNIKGQINIDDNKIAIIGEGITKYYINYGNLEDLKKTNISTIENIKILKKKQ